MTVTHLLRRNAGDARARAFSDLRTPYSDLRTPISVLRVRTSENQPKHAPSGVLERTSLNKPLRSAARATRKRQNAPEKTPDNGRALRNRTRRDRAHADVARYRVGGGDSRRV